MVLSKCSRRSYSWKFGIILLAGLSIGLSVALLSGDLWYSLALGIIYFIIGYLIVARWDVSMGVLFAGGFLVRITLAFFLYLCLYSDYCLIGDVAYYLEKGKDIAGWLQRGAFISTPIPVAFQDIGYSTYNAVHLLLVDSPLLPVVSNVLVGSLCGFLTWRLALTLGLFNQRNARLIAGLVTFFPPLIYYSALNLKDTLLTFFLLIFTLQGIYLLRNPSWRKLIQLALTFTILSTLRFYMAFLTLFLLSIVWLMQGRTKLGQKLILMIGLIGLLLGIGYWIPSVRLPFQRIIFEGPVQILLTQSERSISHIARSEYFLSGLSRLSLQSVLFTLVHFLLTPNPFFLRGINLLRVPGALGWFLILPYFFSGSCRWIRERQMRQSDGLLIIGLTWATILLYASQPWLADERHRLQLVPFAFIIAVAAWSRPSKCQALINALTWATILLVMSLVTFGVLAV